MALFSRVITYTNGSVLTGPQLNNEFDNIINKMTCEFIEDYSADASTMGSATDPYPSETASLATNLIGELTNMRYAIAEHGQVDTWYKDKYRVRTVTNTDSPVTVSVDDWLIYCDTSSGNIELDLPALASLPSGITKSFIFIKTSASNNLTIDPNGTENLFGSSTSLVLTDQWATLHLFAEDGGSQWVSPHGNTFPSKVMVMGEGQELAKLVVTQGASAGDSELRLYTSSSSAFDAYWTLDEDGHFYPDTTEISDVGTTSLKVRAVHVSSGTDDGIVTDSNFSLRILSAVTNEQRGLRIRNETSQNMVDNCGSAVYFQIEDTADVVNTIGLIRANRSGADNTGILHLGAYSTGSFSNYVIANSAGNFYPSSDNAQDCGISGNRWDDIWATNGTIQTSDIREKEDIEDLDLGLDFIKEIEPVKFKWPGGKRKHFSIKAQQIEEVCRRNKIDLRDFAAIVKDEETGRYSYRASEIQAIIIKALKDVAIELTDIKYRLTLLEDK